MHKKIIDNALSLLDPERATYFGSIANSLEEDKRIDDNRNIIYSILKDTMVELPIYLDKKEFIALLLDFTNTNYHRIQRVLFDPDFVRNPAMLRDISAEFVHQVVKLSLEMHESGEIQESKLSVHTLTWPYRDTDVADPEDDPDEWAEAVEKNQKWMESGGIDRRRSGTARIDDVATDIAKQVESDDKTKAPKNPNKLNKPDL